MGKIAQASDGICLTIAGFARELHCNRANLSEKLKSAGLRAAGKSANGYPTYRMHDVFELLLTEINASGHGCDPSQWSPKDRLDHFKAENEKLKLQKAQSEVVLVDEVSTMLATVFKSLTLSLETLPDVIERDVGLTGNQVDAIQRVIDAQRQMLYESLIAAINA